MGFAWRTPESVVVVDSPSAKEASTKMSLEILLREQVVPWPAQSPLQLSHSYPESGAAVHVLLPLWFTELGEQDALPPVPAVAVMV